MKYLLMGLIRLYQIVLSPMVNLRGPVCKFYPSCSHYGYEAVKTHGAIKGSGLTVWRVLRCNPWGRGGVDPVPPKKTRNLWGAKRSSSLQMHNDPADRSEQILDSNPALEVGPPLPNLHGRPDFYSARGV